MKPNNNPLRIDIMFILIALMGIILAGKACLLPAYIDDDADLVYIAETLIRPGNAFWGFVHGPVTYYSIKISRLLFGATPIGGRVLNYVIHILAGVLIYRSVRSFRDVRTGGIAAILYLCNPYVIFNVAYSCEEIYLFFCGMLFIHFCARFITHRQQKDFFLMALALGLGMLVKIQILLLVPGVFLFILLHRELREQVRFRDVLGAGAIVLCISAPYLYSLIQFPFFAGSFAKGMLSLINPSLQFVRLFVYWPPGGEISSYHSALGYNTVGYVIGIGCILAFVRLIVLPKKPYTTLLLYMAAGIICSSFLIFAGEEAEPRHLSLLILPLTIMLADMLAGWLAGSRTKKILAVLYVMAVIFSAARFSWGFPDYARRHSKMSLASWGRPEDNIDLNVLSRAVIRPLKAYPSGLIVFPSDYLDATSHYVMAYSGVQTLSPLREDRYMWDYMGETAKDRITVFLTPDQTADRYIAWADKHGYSHNPPASVTLHLPDGKPALPAEILTLTRPPGHIPTDTEAILTFQDTYDPPERPGHE